MLKHREVCYITLHRSNLLDKTLEQFDGLHRGPSLSWQISSFWVGPISVKQGVMNLEGVSATEYGDPLELVRLIFLFYHRFDASQMNSLWCSMASAYTVNQFSLDWSMKPGNVTLLPPRVVITVSSRWSEWSHLVDAHSRDSLINWFRYWIR